MTQAQDLLPLAIQLTAMQVPESRPQWIAAGGRGLATMLHGDPLEALQPCAVVVYPGEGAELLIRLNNPSPYGLRVALEVGGDFEAGWLQLHTEGQELLPRRAMEAVAHFRIPADFFEQPLAQGGPDRPDPLPPLDYRGEVRLRYGRGDLGEGLPYEQTVPFHLHLRPRSLYTGFLPQMYREVDFIGRFLKIFEQTFEPAFHVSESLWAYLDPLTAPRAMLPFLAHWQGWELFPGLDRQRQRQLLKDAFVLHQWRGTRRGLRLYLHLYTGLPLEEDQAIRIQEIFGLGCLLGQTQIGETAIVGGGQRFHFRVDLYPRPGDPPWDETLLHRIIHQMKPAFCTYDLTIHPAPLS